MTASGEEPDLKAIGDNHMPEDVRQSVREEHEATEATEQERSATETEQDPAAPTTDDDD